MSKNKKINVSIIPLSINVTEFMKHLDKKYTNLTTEEELEKVKKIDFMYVRKGSIITKLYNKKIKYANGYIPKYKFGIKSHLHNDVKRESQKFFSKFFLEQHDLSLKNLSILSRMDKNKMYIVKPIKSNKGVGNKVFRGTKGIKEHLIKNKNKFFYKSRIDGYNQWVIQEYMENPLLINGKKFHVRWNVLLLNNKVYTYETGAVFFAKVKYDSENLDMAVHDTHGCAAPAENKTFPTDFYDMKHTKEIYKNIYAFIKGMKDLEMFKIKCYKGNINCFGMLGIDFMINSNYELKCIEINDSPGFSGSFKHTPFIIEGLLDLTVKEKHNGKGYFEVK